MHKEKRKKTGVGGLVGSFSRACIKPINGKHCQGWHLIKKFQIQPQHLPGLMPLSYVARDLNRPTINIKKPTPKNILAWSG